jgi:type IV secretion system protein VirB4
MTVAVYARTQTALDDIAAEIRNISATSGINLISEAFGARAHFMAQHPGNTGARSRKAAITNHNFADLATFHRTPLGKTGREVPWGVPITLFPTPERSGFRFNFHEQGAPDREPTGGHTLILGRPGSGKSVLAAFLMTMARRAGARVFAPGGIGHARGRPNGIRGLSVEGMAQKTERDGEPMPDHVPLPIGTALPQAQHAASGPSGYHRLSPPCPSVLRNAGPCRDGLSIPEYSGHGPHQRLLSISTYCRSAS